MAYNKVLAERIRQHLAGNGLREMHKFGGVGFLLRGNMLCGVIGDNFIARVGPQQYQVCLARPHVREFDYTGHPMKGWVQVQPEGINEDADLADWIELCRAYHLTLPEKQ